MAVDADQLKAQIVADVGDTDARVVANGISTWWETYDVIANLRLRSFYVKDQAIQALMGAVWKQVRETGLQGVSSDLGSKINHLQAMREANAAALAAYTKLIGGGGQAGGAYGYIEVTAPIMPPPGSGIDANAPRYRGDVYTSTDLDNAHDD